MDWIISIPLVFAGLMGLILSLYNIRNIIVLVACSFILPLSWFLEYLLINGQIMYLWILIIPLFWLLNLIGGIIGYFTGWLIKRYRNKEKQSQNPPLDQIKNPYRGVLLITLVFFMGVGAYDYFQWHFVTRDYFNGRIPLSAKVIFKERKDEGRSGYYSLAYQFPFVDYQNFYGCNVVSAHSLKENKELDRLGLPLKIFGILPDDEQICTNISMEDDWGLILIARKTGAMFIQWNFD